MKKIITVISGFVFFLFSFLIYDLQGYFSSYYSPVFSILFLFLLWADFGVFVSALSCPGQIRFHFSVRPLFLAVFCLFAFGFIYQLCKGLHMPNFLVRAESNLLTLCSSLSGVCLFKGILKSGGGLPPPPSGISDNVPPSL
ncbi:MAG: hypothetical protein ACLSE7_06085 [Lachnospirales bacterium]